MAYENGEQILRDIDLGNGWEDEDPIFDQSDVETAADTHAARLLNSATTPGQKAAMRFVLRLDDRKACRVAEELNVSPPRFHFLCQKAKAIIAKYAETSRF